MFILALRDAIFKEIRVFEVHPLEIRHKIRYVLVPYGKLNGLCRKYGKLAASNGEAT